MGKEVGMRLTLKNNERVTTGSDAEPDLEEISWTHRGDDTRSIISQILVDGPSRE